MHGIPPAMILDVMLLGYGAAVTIEIRQSSALHLVDRSTLMQVFDFRLHNTSYYCRRYMQLHF
jgi:hypothetical protein